MRYTQLTHEKRYQIAALLQAKHNQIEIAMILDTHKSAIIHTVFDNIFFALSGASPNLLTTKLMMKMVFFKRLAVFFALSFWFVAGAWATEFELFTTVPPTLTTSKNIKLQQDAAVFGTAIQTSPQLKEVLVGDIVTFSSSNAVYHIAIKKRKQHSNDDISLIGYTNIGNHVAVITRGNSGTSAIIHTKDGVYKIEQSAFGERIITPDDVSNTIRQPVDEGGIVPDRSDSEKKLIQQNKSQKAKPAQSISSANSTTETIDIMVFWDQAFEIEKGGANAAKTALNQLITLTNTAFEDSKIYIELNLVHSGKLNQPSETSNGETLSAIKNGTGVFSDVPTLRNTYNADLIGILRDYQDEHDSCGNAYQLGSDGVMPNSDRNYGYFVVSDGSNSAGAFCSSTSFAHEIGHNLGSEHDHNHLFSNTPPIFPYSYGHDDCLSGDNCGTFGTIMSYDDEGDNQVNKFSNPNITCKGKPCGIYGTGPTAADNARGFNEIRTDVAGFHLLVTQVCESYITDRHPNLRYSVHNDGTVTDNQTGLIWKVCSQGQTWVDGNPDSCSDTAATYTWEGALTAADNETFATYSDWRVPNIRELRSLATYNCYDPSINRTIFPSTASDWFWSASPDADGSTAWQLNFYGGYDHNYPRDSLNRLRLLRAGQ